VCLSFFLSCVLSDNNLDVVQYPDVAVLEGETVHIHCCWTVDSTRVRVTWQKHQTETDERTIAETVIINKSKCRGSIQKEKSNCSALSLLNITRNDSGGYICKVTVVTDPPPGPRKRYSRHSQSQRDAIIHGIQRVKGKTWDCTDKSSAI
uniref:Ig-like domain-containing protein n=1 Tax=Myripristis murdjan TaxID=586833 RepID=A0A667Y7U8_9TELE